MKKAVEGWKGCRVRGSTGCILAAKIRACKSSIKSCLPARKKDSFSLKALEDRLSEVDNKSMVE